MACRITASAAVPKVKLNEADKVELVLSANHIGNACTYTCLDVRNSERCCNGKLCRDLFTRSESERAIKQLRTEIWTTGPLRDPGTVTSRKTKLLAALKSLVVVDDDDEKKLLFRVNGKEVCKSFYAIAIAIPNKMFNASVAFVLEQDSNAGAAAFAPPIKTMTMKKTDREAMALSFLDTFFHSQGKRKLVDTAPNATGYMKESFTVRMKWTQLYHDHYLPSMTDCDTLPLDYTRCVFFCLFVCLYLCMYACKLIYIYASYDIYKQIGSVS